MTTRDRPPAHYRVDNIPALLSTQTRYSLACNSAHTRVLQEMQRNELSQWDAVIMLRNEYKRAWRPRRGA